MIAIFVLAAVVLVVFGGLLAAADSALTVLSRTDLVDLAAHSRSRRSLLAIAGDMGAHVNALNFTRVVSETTAAVLVSLAFAYSLKDWWWALLASALIMTAVSGALARSDAVHGSDHPHHPPHSRTDRQRARCHWQSRDAGTPEECHVLERRAAALDGG
jgi:CBS domain containing-hemolysin-like protein